MDSFCFRHVYLGKVKYFCKEKDTQYDKLYIYHLICRLKTDNNSYLTALAYSEIPGLF